MNENELIYVAGHRGLVGSAIVRALRNQGFNNLLLKSRDEVDLVVESDVDELFRSERPNVVIDAAARVGGILANNNYPADFICDNLRIQTNLIRSAQQNGVRKLVFLGSSCIYPKHAEQPMTEDALLTGPLEPTNEWYAIAKIAGIKMCQAFRKQYGFNAICLMPTNLYGPGDNFDLETSHVLPALMRKFHEAKLAGAKTVEIWGTGTPRREFLYVDDLADAVVFLTRNYDGGEIVNIGVGEDVTIRELAETIAKSVGFQGELTFDSSKPDGTPRKLLNINKLRDLGWQPRWSLSDGIVETYAWYTKHASV